MTTTKIRLDTGYTTSYPKREDWNRDSVTEQVEVSLYTDGSKMSCGVGAGIFDEFWGIETAFNIQDSAKLFQAQLLAILEAVRLQIQRGLRCTTSLYGGERNISNITAVSTDHRHANTCKLSQRKQNEHLFCMLLASSNSILKSFLNVFDFCDLYFCQYFYQLYLRPIVGLFYCRT